MQKTPYDDDDAESIVIDEDAAGQRTKVDILCLSIGFLGVRDLPTECDVIIVNGGVFIAGWEEYKSKYTPF